MSSSCDKSFCFLKGLLLCDSTGSHLLQMSLIRTAGTAGDLVFCQFKNTSLHSLIHSVSFLSVCFSAPHISSGSAQKRQPPPVVKWKNDLLRRQSLVRHSASSTVFLEYVMVQAEAQSNSCPFMSLKEDVPFLLTTACVGAVRGRDSYLCTLCAATFWPVTSPDPPASPDRGCAG